MLLKAAQREGEKSGDGYWRNCYLNEAVIDMPDRGFSILSSGKQYTFATVNQPCLIHLGGCDESVHHIKGASAMVQNTLAYDFSERKSFKSPCKLKF